jgi:phospholipid/cholesterol/gamma-HCH transport system ATP-binding protein
MSHGQDEVSDGETTRAGIRLRDVHKAFGDRQVLRGITFAVEKGTNYVIMGGSGTGKSVILRHIIGILKPDQGSVQVDSIEVPQLDRRGLMQLRMRMGYLFQSGALINWLSVADNVGLPLREHDRRLSRTDARAKVMDVLQLVGMEHAADQMPARISGGMKLRTGLARALITRPQYVLYDEPNAGLDPLTADQIHRLIVRVRDEVGVTGLIVTHSKACAMLCGDRIGVAENGRILAEGTPQEMAHSDHELVRAFLSGGAD